MPRTARALTKSRDDQSTIGGLPGIVLPGQHSQARTPEP